MNTKGREENETRFNVVNNYENTSGENLRTGIEEHFQRPS